MLLRVLLKISVFGLMVKGHDYCAHEYFNPECAEDEVMVMEQAAFGRMDIGRCLEIEIDEISRNNPKYFGCAADVLDILDNKCSGHQKCNVHVTDPLLLRRSSCYRELVQYLSAKHTCIPVFRADKSCTVGLASSSIHLSIETSHLIKNCGSSNNPWIVEAPPGQNINVSMMTFGNTSNGSRQAHERNVNIVSKCKSGSSGKIVGRITDSNEKVSCDICISNKRQEYVMISKTSKVDIELTEKNGVRFILKFEVTGCYDLKPPQDAWMKRDGNEITVGCYMNRHTWKLICNGRNWIGVIGNCTQQSQDVLDIENEAAPMEEKVPDQASKVFLATIGLSSLVLILLVLLCGCMLLWQRMSNGKKLQNNLLYTKGDIQICTNNINRNTDSYDSSKGYELTGNGKPYRDPCYFVLEDDKENKMTSDVQ